MGANSSYTVGPMKDCTSVVAHRSHVNRDDMLAHADKLEVAPLLHTVVGSDLRFRIPHDIAHDTAHVNHAHTFGAILHCFVVHGLCLNFRFRADCFENLLTLRSFEEWN